MAKQVTSIAIPDQSFVAVPNAITVDNYGNTYTTGQYIGEFDFDPSPNSFFVLTSQTNTAFIAKLDVAGNLVWAKEMKSSIDGYSLSRSIAKDAWGNIYITGYFSGTVDFDPSIDSLKLTTANQDNFIAKLDSNGNLIWVKQMSSETQSFADGYSIVLDDWGNAYVAGVFGGTVDFDPGIGIFNLTSGVNQDIFIAKLDVMGNFLWAGRIGNLQSEYAHSMALDSLGNVYLTGRFHGTVDFDLGTGAFDVTGVGLDDCFISKFTPNGDLVWVKQIGGVSSYASGKDIILDSLGNIYITGVFYETVDFNPSINSAYTLINAGSHSAFILKLNPDGNFLWAMKMGATTGYCFPEAIALDISGNIYTVGYFSGTVDFNPGTGVANRTAIGQQDIFICKIHSYGSFASVKQIGGGYGEYGAAITTDNWGNIYTTGYFSDTVNFEPGSNTFTLSSPPGNQDAFVLKLNQCAATNPSISQNGASLTTNITNATYQWIDCNGNVPINGAIGQIFTPATNGNYAVAVLKNGCKDTSACYNIVAVSILENHLSQKIKAYPNPTSGIFTIDLGNEYVATEVQIFSLVGQLLDTESYTHSQLLQVEMPITVGIYFVQVRFPNGELATIKVIKE